MRAYVLLNVVTACQQQGRKPKKIKKWLAVYVYVPVLPLVFSYTRGDMMLSLSSGGRASSHLIGIHV